MKNSLKISIITLFPNIFSEVFSHSILKRAQEKNLLEINTVDLRKFGIGKHKTVDDKPYGGGIGMVLRVDVVDKAIKHTKQNTEGECVVLLDPKGETYNQTFAKKFSKLNHLILICGHYEGFDERIRKLVDYEISLGDFVLSGGEIAAMAIVESVARLAPGVLKEDATSFESFSNIAGSAILEYPQYTRPAMYNNEGVPDVLTSGNFKEIEEYRIREAKKITSKRRPDLKA